MATSDLIAGFILEALESAGGCAELQRSSLADRFNCVPSQINYVISTRFSPEHGYIVESRRGGGGYIRIKRVCPESRQLIMHAVNAVGDELDQQRRGHSYPISITPGCWTRKAQGLFFPLRGIMH
jgi:transcriptional regulator CtsR